MIVLRGIWHSKRHPLFDKRNHKAVYEVNRTLGGTGFDYVEVGRFQQPQGAFVLLVGVSGIHGTDFVTADWYVITGDYDKTLGAWQRVYPLTNTDLQSLIVVNIDDDIMYLRLFKAYTSTPNTLPLVIRIIDMSPPDNVFTEMTGSGNVGADITPVFNSNLISQYNGDIYARGDIKFSTGKTVRPKRIMVGGHQTDNNTTSYVTTTRFLFPGTDVVGTPTVMKAIIWKDAGATSVDIRIYDLTNAQVITTKSGTSDTPVMELLTAPSNLPTGQAIFEIQIKRTGGAGTDYVHESGLSIEWT